MSKRKKTPKTPNSSPCIPKKTKIQEESDSSDNSDPFANWKGAGYCCFCNSECNPCSQSCGACPRRMFWTREFIIKNTPDIDVPESVSSEEF